jgi:phenylpropionate dioxygenase-like ring-hydroxylating dioxygenase large terminal subunit
MKANIKTKEVVQKTTPASVSETTTVFNWKHCWYPVAFVQDLPVNVPYGFSLYGEPLVLFKTGQGQLACLADRCCHRTAKLSDGRVVGDNIECLYHGWQYDIKGRCVHIPQLPEATPIPANACARSLVVAECQGIVWIWAGEPEAADEQDIPTLAILDKPGFVCSDFMQDLPYDQSYLIENVIDPAHADISHDGTQGKRQHAQPLEMDIIESSVRGIQGRWRGTRKPNEVWQSVEFVAPNLVNYTFNLGKADWLVGLAFYSLPLDQGRCRVLVRGYRNFFLWGWILKPRWLTHLKLNKTFEQDLPLIVGQQESVAGSGCHLKDLYLPLKTSDVFAIEYRKWLDRFGSTLPSYEGYSNRNSSRVEALARPSLLFDRFWRHTRLCHACKQTYQRVSALQSLCVTLAIILAAIAIALDSTPSQTFLTVLASLAATVLAFVLHHFKTQFEHS